MTNITGFCVRAYAGYEFRLVERASNRAKVEVKFPDGKKYEDVWLTLDEVKTVGEIRVGLLHPYDKGGYAVIYALE